MRAEGSRKLDDIDFRQASYDSKFGSDSRKKDGAQKERHREVTFDALGDELIPTNEPMATQQKDAPKLKIVLGVPTPESANPFGETAMGKTMLQPKVRIVDDELRDIDVFVDNNNVERIEEVRRRIQGMGSAGEERPRKSA